ncbi:MAG: hypothetical protein V7679_13405, partial [Parasphingorhabdus sp.]
GKSIYGGASRQQKPHVSQSGKLQLFSVLKTVQISFLLARRATARPVSKSVVSAGYREMRAFGQEGLSEIVSAKVRILRRLRLIALRF